MKRAQRITVNGLVVLSAGWVLYGLAGHFLIRKLYTGGVPILRHIIEGQTEHPVEFYYRLGDMLMFKLSVAAVVLIVIFAAAGWLAPAFMKRYPNAAAALFGVAVAVFALFLMETAARLLPDEHSAKKFYYAPGYARTDEHGIPTAAAGAHRSYKKILKTGQYIYDVVYSVDEYGRRITPVKHPEQRDRFLMFAGCSFIYGEGVEEDQTLPAVAGSLARGYTPYNYGFHGRGPFDALAVVENLDTAGIREKNGTLVYLYMGDHIDRLLGSMSVLRWKTDGIYYKRTPDGRFVRRGTFKTGRPVTSAILKTLGKSKLLGRMRIDFPPRHTPAHYRLMAEVLAAMRESFQEKYPDGKFYVAIYPSSKSGGELIPALEAEGIAYLNYQGLFDNHDPSYYLDELDKHPSALAYRLLAERLVNDLGIL